MSSHAGYVLVIERGVDGYGVFAPDLPGCVATGKTREQAVRRMRQAIAAHIEGLREDGIAIPEPTTEIEYVAV